MLSCLILYSISLISEGYISVYTDTVWVQGPDSIGSAGLLASNSGTSTHIQRMHTKVLAGLFTAAWQHPCLLNWALVLEACWRIQTHSAAASQLHLTSSYHDKLSAHQQLQPKPVIQCALQMGMWRTWASNWWVNNELQIIQAILQTVPSSEL